MSAATSTRPSVIVEQVEVTAVRRLSPSFVRIELGGPALAEFGVDGPLLDQRIKLVLPADSGALPDLRADDWYAGWCALPEGQRGHLRTYTVSSSYGAGPATRVLVDIVLHAGGQGPGSRWAEGVRVGDRVVLVGPRQGVDWGGIEFAPGAATRLLLAADETAVPAVGGILAGLPAGLTGAAFLEVPEAGDLLDLPTVAGVSVTWLPRHGAEHGSRLLPAVLEHCGIRSPGVDLPDAVEVDPDLWETPAYSSSGEPIDDAGTGLAGLYAWIAGESRVVTRLRRALVGEVGLHRSQVAFMGYWREGVSMRG